MADYNEDNFTDSSVEKSAKYKVGDTVDFVNDFGIAFEQKTVTEVHIYDDEIKYNIEPKENPLMEVHERNLYIPGTYSSMLELNNGEIVNHIKNTDFGEKIYLLNNKKVILNSNVLYSINNYMEPDTILDYQYQPSEDQNKINLSLLEDSVKNNNLRAAQYLLEENKAIFKDEGIKKIIKSTQADDETLLFTKFFLFNFCEKNDIKMIKELFNEVKFSDNDITEALCIAAEKGNIETINTIEELENIPSRAYHFMIETAIYNNKEDIAIQITNDGNNFDLDSLLAMALEANFNLFAKKLISLGAKTDKNTYKDFEPLKSVIFDKKDLNNILLGYDKFSTLNHIIHLMGYEFVSTVNKDNKIISTEFYKEGKPTKLNKEMILKFIESNFEYSIDKDIYTIKTDKQSALLRKKETLEQSKKTKESNNQTEEIVDNKEMEKEIIEEEYKHIEH